jgi:ABC-type uncharacterized transport system substrate-binding protein
MRRRDFIKSVVGSTAVIWPRAARAQQTERMRRIGVLMAHTENDPEFKDYLDAFRQGLQKLGWIEGRNINIDTRWGALDDAEMRQRSANELIALGPDIILTQNTPPTASMLQQTRTIPVIFVIVADPVGSNFVASLARPGGNATGFTIMEPTITGKWLELLKEIAPHVTRAAFMFNPATAPYVKIYLDTFTAAAASYGVEMILAPVHDKADLHTVIARQAREPNGGLIVIPDGFLNVHARRSFRWLPATVFRSSILGVSSHNKAASCHMEVRCVMSFDLRRAMSIASSKARSRASFLYRLRSIMSW